MRALLPEPASEVDLLEAYTLPDAVVDDGGHVRCNMITSFDGAIAVDGRAGPLGGPADRRVFQVLRSLCDVVVVGAGTARAEGYGPVRLDEELRRRRTSRGQAGVPPVAVVTRTGNLDWSAPFFTEAEARPIVVTTAAVGERVAAQARSAAQVVVAGDVDVDLSVALGHFHREGMRSVLVEGGPMLNAGVVEAGLLDELCLTMSLRLVDGDRRGVFGPLHPARLLELEVVHLLEEDGLFFWRLAAPGRG